MMVWRRLMPAVAIGGAMLIIWIVVGFFWPFGPDPRFTIEHLRDKPLSQIEQELGPPTVDEKDIPGPNERTLIYRDPHSYIMGYAYGIILENGKVYRVTVGHK